MRAFMYGYSPTGEMPSIPENELKDHLVAKQVEERDFWKTNDIDAELIVELPFWLLVAEGHIQASHSRTMLDVTVIQSGVAVYKGPFYLDSQKNIWWLGKQSDIPEGGMDFGTPCPIFRSLRTTLSLPVRIKEGVIDAIGGVRSLSADDHVGLRKYHFCQEYAKFLAIAHLPIVNNLISKYRSSTHDPFAFELSEFDLRSWFLRRDNTIVHFNVMPYWDFDDPPGYVDNGESTPLDSPDVSSVSAVSFTRLSAGLQEILDATSYMQRGRYNEVIRYCVTAIEVLVEEQLRELYLKNGMSHTQVQQKLLKSRNNFSLRIDDYESLSGRRLPGPCIDVLPHRNGIRLKDELNTVREVRHEIVHTGRRVGPLEKGLAQRCKDTMYWLYQTIAQDKHFDEASKLNREMYVLLRGLSDRKFNPEFREGHVEVVSKRMTADDDSRLSIVREQHLQQFIIAFTDKHGDPELLTAMALTYLGLMVYDGRHGRPPVQVERFLGFRLTGEWVMVSFIDEPTDITLQAVDLIRTQLQLRERELGRPGRCVIVTCLGRRTALSESKTYYTLNTDTVAMLEDHCIHVITPLQLFQYGVGIECLNWDSSLLWNDMMGQVRTYPSFYGPLGKIEAIFPKARVIGIPISSGVSVKVGDVISIECGLWFREGKVLSLEVDRIQSDSVCGPCKVGIGVQASDEGHIVKRGMQVFLRTDSPASVRNKHLYRMSLEELMSMGDDDEAPGNEDCCK